MDGQGGRLGMSSRRAEGKHDAYLDTAWTSERFEPDSAPPQIASTGHLYHRGTGATTQAGLPIAV